MRQSVGVTLYVENAAPPGSKHPAHTLPQIDVGYNFLARAFSCAECFFSATSGGNQRQRQIVTNGVIDGQFLLTFLLLSSSACVRTASSFSRAASVLCRTPSFSSSFCTTSSWASTWAATATQNTQHSSDTNPVRTCAVAVLGSPGS